MRQLREAVAGGVESTALLDAGSEIFSLPAGRLRPREGQIELIDPVELETDERTLLVHRASMTATLRDFHGEEIVVETLDPWSSPAVYARESRLRTAASNRPVLHAWIAIAWNHLPESVGDGLAFGSRPFGTLLDEAGIAFRHAPQSYLRLRGAPGTASGLGLPAEAEPVGRDVIVTDRSGLTLARSIEFVAGTARSQRCSGSRG